MAHRPLAHNSHAQFEREIAAYHDNNQGCIPEKQLRETVINKWHQYLNTNPMSRAVQAREMAEEEERKRINAIKHTPEWCCEFHRDKLILLMIIFFALAAVALITCVHKGLIPTSPNYPVLNAFKSII